MPGSETNIQSLVLATDLDVLAPDRLVTRRDGYWAVRSPGNPSFWWGNLLIFDDAPGAGDGARWEQLFAREFAEVPEVRHRTFTWDRVDGGAGAAEDEFKGRGYEIERTAGLLARPDEIRPHPRANHEVDIHRLEQDADGGLWAQVIDLQAAGVPAGIEPAEHRQFLIQRQHELRELFAAGGGAWFVALEDSHVVGSLGIVVSGGRARYQAVDTAASHRGRGIASRLVVEAARLTGERHHVDHFVIAADPGYHAISIYESVGFQRAEVITGAVRRPPGEPA